MSSVTIREWKDGLWAIDYITGEWATAYGLTKEEAEYYLVNFDFDEIEKKWGWH